MLSAMSIFLPCFNGENAGGANKKMFCMQTKASTPGRLAQ